MAIFGMCQCQEGGKALKINVMNKDVRALKDALEKESVHCMEFSNDNHFDEQCQNLLLWLHLTNWKTMIV